MNVWKSYLATYNKLHAIIWKFYQLSNKILHVKFLFIFNNFFIDADAYCQQKELSLREAILFKHSWFPKSNSFDSKAQTLTKTAYYYKVGFFSPKKYQYKNYIFNILTTIMYKSKRY